MRRAFTILISAAALGTFGCGGGGGGSTTFTVPSPSMAPTFRIDDVVRIDRGAYSKDQPQRGDIVIVYAPAGAERNACGVPGSPGDGRPCGLPAGGKGDIQLIKRVVATGGDRVHILHNRVVLDGRLQPEPFARTSDCLPSVCTLPRDVVVPPGYVFLMGDNRAASDDSREFGPVPAKWVVGRVTGLVSRGEQGGGAGG